MKGDATVQVGRAYVVQRFEGVTEEFGLSTVVGSQWSSLRCSMMWKVEGESGQLLDGREREGERGWGRQHRERGGGREA